MTKKKATITEGNIADLIQDDRNLNRHNERGSAAIYDSIDRLGIGRGVLADKNGKLIGGNATVEQAIKAGKKKIVVVETDGDTLVVTKRTDLDLDTDSKAREMAYLDNHTAALNLTWDEEEKERQGEEFGFDVEAWGGGENQSGEIAGDFSDPGISGQNKFAVTVLCDSEAEQEVLYMRLTGEGLTCKIVVV